MPLPHKSHWHGCCARSRTSYLFPAHAGLSRLLENAGAADVTLSAEEVSVIDETLNGMEMSEVFGGSKTVNR